AVAAAVAAASPPPALASAWAAGVDMRALLPLDDVVNGLQELAAPLCNAGAIDVGVAVHAHHADGLPPLPVLLQVLEHDGPERSAFTGGPEGGQEGIPGLALAGELARG